MWDRFFRKEFGNWDAEKSGNLRKLTDLGLEARIWALTGFTWIEKGIPDGLEWFGGPKTPKHDKKTSKIKDLEGKSLTPIPG